MIVSSPVDQMSHLQSFMMIGSFSTAILAPGQARESQL
jgi:hypothetical protein